MVLTVDKVRKHLHQQWNTNVGWISFISVQERFVYTHFTL